jgi:hypothetical protein
MDANSGNTTIEKIRKLAEKRQALWSKMSSLTVADRAAIVRLTQDLEALWEQHRLELAQRSVSQIRPRAKGVAASARRRTAA